MIYFHEPPEMIIIYDSNMIILSCLSRYLSPYFPIHLTKRRGELTVSASAYQLKSWKEKYGACTTPIYNGVGRV